MNFCWLLLWNKHLIIYHLNVTFVYLYRENRECSLIQCQHLPPAALQSLTPVLYHKIMPPSPTLHFRLPQVKKNKKKHTIMGPDIWFIITVLFTCLFWILSKFHINCLESFCRTHTIKNVVVIAKLKPIERFRNKIMKNSWKMGLCITEKLVLISAVQYLLKRCSCVNNLI